MLEKLKSCHRLAHLMTGQLDKQTSILGAGGALRSLFQVLRYLSWPRKTWDVFSKTSSILKSDVLVNHKKKQSITKTKNINLKMSDLSTARSKAEQSKLQRRRRRHFRRLCGRWPPWCGWAWCDPSAPTWKRWRIDRIHKRNRSKLSTNWKNQIKTGCFILHPNDLPMNFDPIIQLITIMDHMIQTNWIHKHHHQKPSKKIMSRSSVDVFRHGTSPRFGPQRGRWAPRRAEASQPHEGSRHLKTLREKIWFHRHDCVSFLSESGWFFGCFLLLIWVLEKQRSMILWKSKPTSSSKKLTGAVAKDLCPRLTKSCVP